MENYKVLQISDITGIMIESSIFQLFPISFMGNGNFVFFTGLTKIKMVFCHNFVRLRSKNF